MVLYTNLESRWVRLLKIHTGEYDSMIICDMVDCWFDNASHLKYMALSYTWGFELPTFEIQVNEARIPVRSNLFQALRQIRAAPGQIEAISSESYWWIDSICINQQNDIEKGQQVAMMGDIYERSELTVAYLGELGDDGPLAMQMLYRIASAQKKEACGLVHQGTTDQLNALTNFFQRPWWIRAWTTQEYILPNHLHFLCGDQSLSRRNFQLALLRLQSCSRSVSKYRPVHLANGFIMAGKRKKILDRRYDILQGVGPTPDLPLCDFLVYAGGSTATLERDCVFSTLGLVSNPDNLNLKPCYDGGGCIAIFEQVARSHIASSKCLDIICFADASPRDAKIQCPSWVPYWPNHTAQASDHLTWQSFPALASHRKTTNQNYREGSNKHEAIQSARFKASGGVPPAVSDDFRPGALFCQALIAGRIRALAESFVAEERNEAVKLRQSTFMLESTSKVLAPDNQHNQDSDEVWWKKALEYQPPENLWKTIVLDRKDSFLDRPAPHDYSYDFKWLLFKAIEDPTALNTKTVLWFRHHASILFESHPNSIEIIKRLNCTPGRARMISHFEDQMHHVWINMRKRLLISDKQAWGMATKGAMLEDIICVLAGCNFPVIIREIGKTGYYQLIGECYLDGIMYGEIYNPIKETSQTKAIYLV